MKGFPIMFRRCITKHVSGFCVCNEHLSHYNRANKVSDKCLACGGSHETTAHITVCPDRERSQIYSSSVDNVVEWMRRHDTAPDLASYIENYLRARGSKTMGSIVHNCSSPEYQLFAKYQDILGWQNFIEGRFLSYMVQIQREYLQTRDSWRTAESWVRDLIEQVLRITHRQWLQRNAIIHYRLSDGPTVAEKEKIVARVMELI